MQAITVQDRAAGTTGLTVGQRVFGLADWTRDGSLADGHRVPGKTIIHVTPADK